MSKMESSIQPVTNQPSSKTEEDRLMIAKDDIETYRSKADENNYAMNIEEKVNCSNKKLCLHCFILIYSYNVALFHHVQMILYIFAI